MSAYTCGQEHPDGAYIPGKSRRKQCDHGPEALRPRSDGKGVRCIRCRAERLKAYQRDPEVRARRRARAQARAAARGKKPLGRKGQFQNAQLREMVLDAQARDPGLTWYEIAERAGWEGHESTRIQRALGVTGYTDKDGVRRLPNTCSENMALCIARAIHVDPWEIGL